MAYLVDSGWGLVNGKAFGFWLLAVGGWRVSNGTQMTRIGQI